MSRVYYTGSSPLGGTTPMRTLEAMTGYYGIVGYPVPQLPHGVTASRGNFLITGRSADLLLFGPVYYGCGAQPTIPPGAATLTGIIVFIGGAYSDISHKHASCTLKTRPLKKMSVKKFLGL